jgi:hypothetical protein
MDKKISIFKITLECHYNVQSGSFDKLVDYTPEEIIKLNRSESVAKNKNDFRTKKISKDYDLNGEFDVLGEMAKFDVNMDDEDNDDGDDDEDDDEDDNKEVEIESEDSSSSEEMEVIPKKGAGKAKGKGKQGSKFTPKKVVEPKGKGGKGKK